MEGEEGKDQVTKLSEDTPKRAASLAEAALLDTHYNKNYLIGLAK